MELEVKGFPSLPVELPGVESSRTKSFICFNKRVEGLIQSGERTASFRPEAFPDMISTSESTKYAKQG